MLATAMAFTMIAAAQERPAAPAASSAAAVGAGPRELPAAAPVGKLEVVATFDGPMPTGVAVSKSGRVFVNFPRWGDAVAYTVAELRDGRPVAFPDAARNRADEPLAEHFVSVQSVVVDPQERLWALDTGRPEWRAPAPGGPKLVGIDLTSNAVVKTIVIPPDVALPTTYLNDVRFDLRRGAGGMAFITDSSNNGPPGIIVVDLATGQARRRLSDHPSTRAEPNFRALVEGRPFLIHTPGQPAAHLTVGADGIALSPDGQRLYYCPLAGRGLFSVSVDALCDPQQDDAAVARTVESYGDRGFASDGLEMDATGRLFLTDYEDNAIVCRTAAGVYTTLAYDPRLLWPDTLALGPDGRLYVTANQLHRQAQFRGGRDERVRPYVLFAVRVEGVSVAGAARPMIR